jgi:hypothetical protein
MHPVTHKSVLIPGNPGDELRLFEEKADVGKD